MVTVVEKIKEVFFKKTRLLSGVEIEEGHVRILFLDRESSVTFYKPIEFEVKKEEEWNIKEEIQTIKGETVYDFAIVGEEEDMYNILVVVAKREEIEEIENLEKNSNITIKHIDSNLIALLNIAQLHKEKRGSLGEEDSIICILHVDKDISYIVHFQNNISTQILNFNLSGYSSLEENMAEVTKLANEINYFFLTVNEPSTVYISGEILEYPEIKEFIQTKFVGKFAFVDMNPAEVLDINYTGDKHPGVYSIPFGLIYRGLSE